MVNLLLNTSIHSSNHNRIEVTVPQDMLFAIFQELKFSEIVRCRSLSTEWKVVVDNLTINDELKRIIKHFIDPVPQNCSWETINRRMIADNNIERGVYANYKYCNNIKSVKKECFHVVNDKIISVDYLSETFTVSELTTGEIFYTCDCDDWRIWGIYGIDSMYCSDKIIACGDAYGKVLILENSENYKYIKTLEDNYEIGLSTGKFTPGNLKKLFATEGMLLGVIGNANNATCAIRVWDLEKLEYLYEVSGWGVATGPMGELGSYLVADGKIAIHGYDESEVKVYDLKTGNPLAPIKTADGSRIKTTCFAQGKFILSGICKDEPFIEIREGFDSDKLLHTLKEGKHCATLLKHVGNRLISHDKNYRCSSTDCVLPQPTMMIWDINDGTLLLNNISQPTVFNDILIREGMYILFGSGGEFGFGDIKTGKVFSRFNFDHKLNRAVNRGCARTIILDDRIIQSNSNSKGIHVLDLNPSCNKIIEEIADAFKFYSENWDFAIAKTKYVNELFRRFSLFPEHVKNAIYGELFVIVQPEKHYWGMGEDLFHDQNGQATLHSQKAKAIRNYLEKQELSK